MKRIDHYQSVELSVDGLDLSYRFKIWHIHPRLNVIVVRKDSNILPYLRVGERHRVKYYYLGEAYPDGVRETTIKEISKKEQGRFKGHFLVDLEPLQ
jgi:hypothetical protein